MTSLFISYSRKDIDSARKLTEAFKGQGLDFWIDWEGIPPTVDWWKEIEKGIEEADTFLFLISPDSAKSKYCGKEIEHAASNGKRLIPVVVRDIQADDSPQKLKALNWIFLREQDDFNNAFSKLITAIKTDYEWAGTHRQLQLKALEWERNNKENSFLLRGKELQDAELQLATNSSKEPHPTDLQREYVFNSKKAWVRQRRVVANITIAIVIIIAWLTYAPLKLWLTAPELPGWRPIKSYQEDSPHILAMNLRNPDEVYVSGQSTGELYNSTDGGKAWHKINLLEIKSEIVGLAAIENKVYAITNQTVWLSHNGGESWTTLENLSLDKKTKLLSISVNPQNGNEIYVGSNDGVVYHTKDIGITWNMVQPGYDGKLVNSITTNGFVIILATEEGLWVQIIGNKNWDEISLVGCSERSDEINSLALTYPYSEPPPDGAFGFIAAVPGIGVCDSDSKNLHGNTLLPLQYTEFSSMTIADQADLVAYEGYIASGEKLLRKRIWYSADFEWWKIKIKSLFTKGE